MAIILDGLTGITTPGLTNTGTETIVNLTTTGNTILGDASTDTLNVGNGGLVKDASGNVGIGTASPGTVLNVVGTTGIRVRGANSASDGALDLRADNTSCSINAATFGTSVPLVFKTDGTERMRIDSSGNVGIGTSSITKKLTVYQNQNGIRLAHDFTTADYAELSFSSIGVAGNGASIRSYRTSTSYNGNEGDLRFYTNTGAAGASSDGSEAARIDSSGNLLVGATSSGGVGHTFYPQGFYRTARSGTASQTHIFFNNGNGDVGSISTSGSSTTYSTSSDYRLKENIAPMTGALAKVQQLKPVTYKWKADGSDGEGFIAHELAEVVPDAVVGEKDAVDAEGNSVYQGIDTSFLVATLTAAIQELKALVDTQASTITTLTDRITALEGSTPA